MSALTPSSEICLPKLSEGRKKKWSFSSLAFSAFYFVPLFISDNLPSSTVFLSIFFYIAFIGVYIWTISANKPALGVTLLICVISASILVNIGGFTLFGYPLFVAAYHFEKRKALLCALAVLFIAAGFQLAFWHAPWILFAQCVLVCGGLFAFGMMERKETLYELLQQRSNEEISQLSAIAERERIGRDLHDVAGHALSSISLKAQLALKLMQKNRQEEAQAELAALAQLSQELLSEVRKTVSGIKHLSLSENIDKLDAQLRKNNIALIRDIDESLLSVWTASQETHIALILQEAVTNVLRHSNASVLRLSLLRQEDQKEKSNIVCLCIHDNGIMKKDITRGNGLNGMQERVNILEGSIDIACENGCSIHIKLPLQTKD